MTVLLGDLRPSVEDGSSSSSVAPSGSPHTSGLDMHEKMKRATNRTWINTHEGMGQVPEMDNSQVSFWPRLYPCPALASHFTSVALSFCIRKGRSGFCTIPPSSEVLSAVISILGHTCMPHWTCDSRLWLTWHHGTWT